MTTANKYVGEVSLDIAGKKYILRYDWNAIGKLKTKFGPDFDQKISRASIESDMVIMAVVLAIGLERHHPGKLPVEKIIDLSPPVVPVVDAINKAIVYAYHGTTEVSAQPEENPMMAVRLLKKLIPFLKRRKQLTATA